MLNQYAAYNVETFFMICKSKNVLCECVDRKSVKAKFQNLFLFSKIKPKKKENIKVNS